MSGRRAKNQRESTKAALAARIEEELQNELGEPARKMSRAELHAWDRWVRRPKRLPLPKQFSQPPRKGDVEVLYAKLRDELVDRLR